MNTRTEQRFEESNREARKRSDARKFAYDEWRKNRSSDPMVPYVRVGDSDSRPVVDSGPPVRRAYIHTYGFVRAERRAGMAVLNRNRRREYRAKRKILFQQIWESERAHNAAT